MINAWHILFLIDKCNVHGEYGLVTLFSLFVYVKNMLNKV